MEDATRPPKSMSPEEYEELWKPEGWRLMIIGPTATWRAEWMEWEAIRDIVQNALDEAEAYSWGYDDEGLWISDTGRGIAVEEFLLGPPKLKPEYARGRFGEGMKIGALALLRLGYQVRVETTDKVIWMLFYRQKVNGHAETLAALWKPAMHPSGTAFHIIGYTGTSYQDRFAVNLAPQCKLLAVPSRVTEPRQRFNELYREGRDEGRIFSRDIYLRDIQSRFSYNLWGFELAPDRHAPKSEHDVWVDIGRVWCCVKDPALLREFLMMITASRGREEDVRQIVIERGNMGKDPVSNKDYWDIATEDNKGLWQQAWHDVFGPKAVIQTRDDLGNYLEHLGYSSVTIPTWGVSSFFQTLIVTDVQIVRTSQERMADKTIVNDSALNPRALAHLVFARTMGDRLSRRNLEGIRVARLQEPAPGVEPDGLYDRNAREIYLDLRIMSTLDEVVDATIHELAHHNTDAEDGDPKHYQELSSLGSSLAQGLARGYFDDALKNENISWEQWD